MLRTILNRMYAIRDGRTPVEIDAGLCYNVAKAYPDNAIMRVEVRQWLARQFPHWPEYSGQLHYPVPHPTHSASDAYEIATCEDGDAWDESTEYGAARHRLLDFLIARAEGEVAALAT
ncbi:MAG TPA: hypothetical protein VM783_18005 [Candidatus Acidoferrum sp.]|nr:hypothetical protein [Candidatus Acidoferrum sp.]